MGLKISEIFKSIQGESTFAGLPCVFVRLSGCNLRCYYCDTTYAYEEGRSMHIDEICGIIYNFGANLVCVTGGEPLIQDSLPELTGKLIEKGYKVLVETNGSVRIDCLPDNVIKIMDIKCPDSGMCDKMDWNNIALLRHEDEVKFVLSSRNDYNWAKGVILDYHLENKVVLLFSVVFGKLELADLAKWILEDKLNVRLQLQLHKFIWDPETKEGCRY